MLKRLSTDTINWILIIGVILFIIEIAFFHGGMIGTAAFTGFLAYIGWKNYHTLWGKVMFWIGFISFVFAILNMIAVRFLIVIFLILLLVDYAKSRNENEKVEPSAYVEKQPPFDEPMIQMNPLFRQILYGNQHTENSAYEWQDINIHGGIGDRVIDLSNTVLPDDTAVISIRHFIGNIIIYVPYETELMIHHSAVFGRAYIFNKNHYNLMNQNISYKTQYYDTTHSRIKIITSLISGNIEVKRI
ncbi:cell wall-active antibiotics response protein LiaF [Pseudogracilibacillus auburnensis]|uniref:Putative membrane protein n=1 Tax=Pseudogracilibacillus auburnensis TaxID=1494959 RepID=A0A2V3VW35_9BACI|nr:cell wall-active antibiotics response protein LiaF [Pseudogracilibacillus auburnensis]MBO1004279.1 hypothetical protein [Pseudogracilibacillus auburnensis]PXW85031.1 putative membrane protein [Pseudogracilibacillus auburnensis]